MCVCVMERGPTPWWSPDQKGVYMCVCLWSFWTEDGTWAGVADKEGVGSCGVTMHGCRAWGRGATGDGMV